jgi:hypothetical protein
MGRISNQVRPAAVDRNMSRQPVTPPEYVAPLRQPPNWQQARSAFADGLQGFSDGMRAQPPSEGQGFQQGMQRLGDGLRYRMSPESQFPTAPGGASPSWADMFSQLFARRGGGLY